MRKQFIAAVAAAGFSLLCSIGAFASTVFQTVGAPSPGCALVAVEGSYNVDAQTALERINAIRLEACKEGVKDPRNENRSLTEADYVPIQWSSSLEYIARVRAAESSIMISHTRPNGTSCFTVVSPDGKQSYGENLAWNWSKTILSGIEQWYEEKNDWVNDTGGVTGHYTSMIDPDYTYIGLSSFTNAGGVYYNTVSAEFDGYDEHDTKVSSPVSDCEVILEIQTTALSSPQLTAVEKKLQRDGCLDKGDTIAYRLGMTSTLEGDTAIVFDAGSITWKSSQNSVATVTQSGLVAICGAGTVQINAASSSGNTATATITAAHAFRDWEVTVPATVSKEGTTVRTCSICGEKETKSIPVLQPKLILSKTSVKVKKPKSASVKVTIANGDNVKVQSSKAAIATVSYADGQVTIKAKKKAGTATITVKTGTGLSKKIKVVVAKAATTKITCKKVTVKKGKKVTLKPVITPAYSDDKIAYISANKKIAKVTAKGVVKGVKKGTTYITVKSGKKKVKVKVTVK